MASYGRSSRQRLSTCHPKLIQLFEEVIKYKNCSIICGEREEAEQNKAYDNGLSKLKFPESKHNKSPSLALDVYPYDETLKLALSGHPIQIKHISETYKISEEQAKQYIKEEYLMLWGVISLLAKQLDIKIRWGGDWDCDGFRLDQSFNDLPHIELL